MNDWIWSCCVVALVSSIRSILFCRMMMCFSCMISTAARCSAGAENRRRRQNKLLWANRNPNTLLSCRSTGIRRMLRGNSESKMGAPCLETL